MRIGIAAGLLVIGVGAAHAQGSFDGVYRAPPGGTAGNARCATTMFAYPLRVTNGVASLMTVSSGELQGPVGPDGSLSLRQGVAALDGRISGGRFTGNLVVGRQGCAFSLQYSK